MGKFLIFLKKKKKKREDLPPSFLWRDAPHTGTYGGGWRGRSGPTSEAPPPHAQWRATCEPASNSWRFSPWPWSPAQATTVEVLRDENGSWARGGEHSENVSKYFASKSLRYQYQTLRPIIRVVDSFPELSNFIIYQKGRVCQIRCRYLAYRCCTSTKDVESWISWDWEFSTACSCFEFVSFSRIQRFFDHMFQIWWSENQTRYLCSQDTFDLWLGWSWCVVVINKVVFTLGKTPWVLPSGNTQWVSPDLECLENRMRDPQGSDRFDGETDTVEMLRTSRMWQKQTRHPFCAE